MSYRIGFGIDFHQLVEGRELWIGGVNIEHNKGALRSFAQDDKGRVGPINFS